jgi:hypothetical protein
MNEHEQAFVRAFVVADKQERYLVKLGSKKHRREFLSRLHHNLDYEPKLATQVPPAEQSALLILERLRKLGAPTQCYTIAADDALDGRELPLKEALEAVVGMGSGIVLSCVPGVLAYYESEEMNGRFVFARALRPNESFERAREG